MRVLVTGGTGTLGRPAARRLLEQGHEVRVLSRQPSPALPGGAAAVRGDLSTGAGVAEAVERTDAVLHAASNTGLGLGRGDVAATECLLDAARSARVAHLLYVSIVGVDRIPLAYYRRKLACEQLVAASGIGHTILRATQFHELLSAALLAVERWPLVPLPVTWRFQPVAAEEAAARAVDLLLSGPHGRAPDFGGPEVTTLGDMARVWRLCRGRPRRVVGIALPGRVARGFRLGLNTCPANASRGRRWAEYVAGLSGVGCGLALGDHNRLVTEAGGFVITSARNAVPLASKAGTLTGVTDPLCPRVFAGSGCGCCLRPQEPHELAHPRGMIRPRPR